MMTTWRNKTTPMYTGALNQGSSNLRGEQLRSFSQRRLRQIIRMPDLTLTSEELMASDS
jgi:hypothetical protein